MLFTQLSFLSARLKSNNSFTVVLSSLVLHLDGAEPPPHLEPAPVALSAAAAPVDLGHDDAARRRQVRRPTRHLPPRARRLRTGTRVTAFKRLLLGCVIRDQPKEKPKCLGCCRNCRNVSAERPANWARPICRRPFRLISMRDSPSG